MALQGYDGSPLRSVSAVVSPETRNAREEAAAGRQPSAGHVSDGARQEDPEKRGVLPGETT